MHYYTFNIGDYHSHTSHLSELEDIAYRRMMDWMYLHESPLPNDADQIARLIRMRSHSESIAIVLCEFFDETEYGYKQKHVMTEIEKFKSKSNKAKASAEARWSARPVKSNANALKAQCEGNANHKPLTTNHKPLDNKKNTTSKPLVNFSRWIELVREAGEKPIPTDSPIFEYAQDAGIDPDYLRLAWVEFKARYTDDTKRYKDWRAVFSKSVRGNWFKLWWHDGEGYKLTTLGQQNMAAMKTRDKREES